MVFGPFCVSRPDGWRPVVHVLSGSRVGALLEVGRQGESGRWWAEVGVSEDM